MIKHWWTTHKRDVYLFAQFVLSWGVLLSYLAGKVPTEFVQGYVMGGVVYSLRELARENKHAKNI